MPTSRRQFSLRDLLVLIVVLSALFGWWHERWSHHKLEQSTIAARVQMLQGQATLIDRLNTLTEQNAQLQARLAKQDPLSADNPDYIRVKDPKKAYIRRMASTLPMRWRYGIYLPPGHTFQFLVRTRDADAQTRLVPKLSGRSSMQILLTPRSFEIEWPGGSWEILTATGYRHAREITPSELIDGSASYEQREMSVDEPIEIVRLTPPGAFEEAILEVFLEAVATGDAP